MIDTVTGIVKNSNSFSNDYQPIKILDSICSSDGSQVRRQLNTIMLVSEADLEGMKDKSIPKEC